MSYKPQSISWRPAELLEEAKERAESLGLSLSKYVCMLVEKDLEAGGDMVLKERPPQYGASDPKQKAETAGSEQLRQHLQGRKARPARKRASS